MSALSLNLMLIATLFAFILMANGTPIDSNEKYEIVVCPEGAQGQNGCKRDEIIFLCVWCLMTLKKFLSLRITVFTLTLPLLSLQWLWWNDKWIKTFSVYVYLIPSSTSLLIAHFFLSFSSFSQRSDWWCCNLSARTTLLKSWRHVCGER